VSDDASGSAPNDDQRDDKTSPAGMRRHLLALCLRLHKKYTQPHLSSVHY